MFTATLWRYPGPAGWIFVTIPPDHVLPATAPFRRTPVLARVDGRTWRTSTFGGAEGVVLPIPARMRRDKGEGDTVEVEISFDVERA